jgi:hypothetical protein
MSKGSKIALASAAGVVAATAAGLATTKTGRRMVRRARKTVTPIVNQRLSTIMHAVESSLEEHGLLDMIPANVRSTIRHRLERLSGSSNGSRRAASNAASHAQSNAGRGRRA